MTNMPIDSLPALEQCNYGELSLVINQLTACTGGRRQLWSAAMHTCTSICDATNDFSSQIHANTTCRTGAAQVLLGSRFHGVFPGHGVVDALDRHFLLHDFTPAALRKGLQVWTNRNLRPGYRLAEC